MHQLRVALRVTSEVIILAFTQSVEAKLWTIYVSDECYQSVTTWNGCLYFLKHVLTPTFGNVTNLIHDAVKG